MQLTSSLNKKSDIFPSRYKSAFCYTTKRATRDINHWHTVVYRVFVAHYTYTLHLRYCCGSLSISLLFSYCLVRNRESTMLRCTGLCVTKIIKLVSTLHTLICDCFIYLWDASLLYFYCASFSFLVQCLQIFMIGSLLTRALASFSFGNVIILQSQSSAY